jgi:NADH-quinone oxidoreductase subunit M
MLTLLLIFFPLAAAFLLFIVRPKQAHVIALVAALVELAISAIVVYEFKTAGERDLRANFYWIESLGLNFYVAIDGISLLLVLLTTVLMPFIILSSFGRTITKPATFYGLILMMQMALIGVFVAQDGLLFYLFLGSCAHSDLFHLPDLGRRESWLDNFQVLCVHTRRKLVYADCINLSVSSDPRCALI